MGSAGKRLPAWPALYGVLYPVILDAAKGSGYAIALHGSLGRDMDVIAVPWTEDAIPECELVDRVGQALTAHWWVELDHISGDPIVCPHGRLVWTVVLEGGAFVDFGVMPRVPSVNAAGSEEESDRELLAFGEWTLTQPVAPEQDVEGLVESLEAMMDRAEVALDMGPAATMYPLPDEVEMLRRARSRLGHILQGCAARSHKEEARTCQRCGSGMTHVGPDTWTCENQSCPSKFDCAARSQGGVR